MSASAIGSPSASPLASAVARYFEACNSGDRDLFFGLFAPDAGHYLPKGMFGPFHDVESLFARWREDAGKTGAYWVADRIYADDAARTAIAEWTAVKPKDGVYFRGVDVFAFDEEGRIVEVRVYYASPRDPSIGDNELGGYDYNDGGWHVPASPVAPNGT